MFRIKYSREILLKILYQIDVMKANAAEAHEIVDNHIRFYKGTNAEEEEFIRGQVQTVLDRGPEIDQAIRANLIGWKLERLTPIDRSLLRMGLAESYTNPTKAVIIDDIVRIAKKYSDQDAYKIVNAILDKIIP
jgi:transcription antitermination protein NusB